MKIEVLVQTLTLQKDGDIYIYIAFVKILSGKVEMVSFALEVFIYIYSVYKYWNNITAYISFKTSSKVEV